MHQLPFMEYEIMHTASYPVALLQCPYFLELGSSKGAVQLYGYDDPIALISRFEAVQCVTAIK